MAGFRRPELEKDNPIAPQPYIGPRRRLAMARAADLGERTEAGDMIEILQALVAAAAQVVKRLPTSMKRNHEVRALRNAIAQAERVLASDGQVKISRVDP